jgi:hypothetical protein
VATTFLLASFELTPEVKPKTIAAGFRPESNALVVEFIHDEDRNERAILLAEANYYDKPTWLRCVFGFADGSHACSIWHDRGFPLIDAIIRSDEKGNIRVSSACFLQDKNEMNYAAEMISIQPTAQPGGSAPAVPLDTTYEQFQQLPDTVFPADQINRKAVVWTPDRDEVIERSPDGLNFKIVGTRFPEFLPISKGFSIPKKVWSGKMKLPDWRQAKFPERQLLAAHRAEAFGVPAFRFEEVEILGFRLNLERLGNRASEHLTEMIDRLNFHLAPPKNKKDPPRRSRVSDFRYRPATSTVNLEVLRYGKMKLKENDPPLGPEDFQSQHELLFRVLVGRVDDDTAQAHDPATFVPAIFVDNPWSKTLGRVVQGFDKRLAHFCVTDENGQRRALLPNGRLSPDAEPRQLGDISSIRLMTGAGKAPDGPILMELDCPHETIENWDQFEQIGLELALGASSLAPTRWRQTDFDLPEFRRSFARSAVSPTLLGFRSIQVAPVGEKELRTKWENETTWINGTFRIDDNVRIVHPNGIVTIALHSEPAAPKEWQGLCAILGIDKGRHRSISLPAGSWYRFRCSMDMIIDNGLN